VCEADHLGGEIFAFTRAYNYKKGRVGGPFSCSMSAVSDFQYPSFLQFGIRDDSSF
jgi:hypothetical protein